MFLHHNNKLIKITSRDGLGTRLTLRVSSSSYSASNGYNASAQLQTVWRGVGGGGSSRGVAGGSKGNTAAGEREGESVDEDVWNVEESESGLWVCSMRVRIRVYNVGER